jgi:hypothetical protein
MSSVLPDDQFFIRRSSIDQKIRCIDRDFRMTADDREEDIPTMSTDTNAPQHSPLSINCDAAMSFVMDYVRSENCPPEIELPDLTDLTNSVFLDKIAEMMLIPALTECISISFYPILPDIVGRWPMFGDQVERIACALGRVLHLESKLKR